MEKVSYADSERAIVLAVIAITLVLLSAGSWVFYLWRSMVSYHSTRLSEQIHDTLYNEIAAGNFFGITAALGRLRMSGLLIDSALIRISHGTIEWLYTSTDEFRLKLDNLGVLLQYCRNGGPGNGIDT